MIHGYCVACGQTGNLAQHHLIPRALGGSDEERKLTRIAMQFKKAKGERVGSIPYGFRLGAVLAGNPQCAERTAAFLHGDLEMKNVDSVMVSVRLPRKMVDAIDEMARETAYREKRKVTRSTLVAEWLRNKIAAYAPQEKEQQP